MSSPVLSEPPPERVLVVNADDFGRTPGINAGIMKTHREGIVTSASAMVRWPAALEAAALAREAPELALGLHVDLKEWVFEDGDWREVYTVVETDDLAVVEAEVRRQSLRFRDLFGKQPTHLDSHQNVHRWTPAIGELLDRLGEELGVPVRQRNGRVAFDGSFYGQALKGDPMHEAISVEHLSEKIRALPPGITELSCHPGLGDDFDSPYRSERHIEVDTLCDDRIRKTIEEEGVQLRSFAEIK